MRLLRESWSFLRERPRLTVLPIVSTVLTTIVALAIGFPVFLAVHHSVDHQAALFITVAAGMWPSTVLGTFLGVAFLAMVMDDLEGREARVGAGLAFARRRLPAIIGWSLLATGVGLLLSALQQLPGVGGWLGRLIGFAGGLAWQLAAFFVLPVLVLEGTGPIESVKRSAHAFRERWGETVTADVGVGAVATFALIPAAMLFAIGYGIADDGNTAAGVALIAVAASVWLLVSGWTRAVTQLFQLVAYRSTTSGIVDGPFSAADIDRAVRPRRRRWFAS